jgi:hypothetical protein
MYVTKTALFEQVLSCCLGALRAAHVCRRYEMVFEYTPTSDTLVESFWSFSIPSQGLVIPFLLVGHVTEPRVALDRPAINFGRVSTSNHTRLYTGSVGF